MTLKTVANFGNVLGLTVTEHPDWTITEDIQSSFMNSIYALPTDKPFCVSLDPYGFFGWPEGHERWLDVGVFRDVGKHDWGLVWVDTHPDFPRWAWVLPFENLIATTDANGNHLGQHPKGAWVMEKTLWQNWLNAVHSGSVLPAPQPTPLPMIKAIIGGFTHLNIRQDAGTNYPVLGTIAIGEGVNLLPDAPKSANGFTWRRLQHGSVIGWLAYSLVVF